MSTVEVNGVRIGYEEHGSGSPVVLVHGLGGNRVDTWKYVTAELATENRVVSVDLRGAGESATTAGPYTIELLAGDLDGLLAALDLGPAALVGHSMGGAIVLLEAAEHPERVRAAVSVGGAIRLSGEQRAGMVSRAETVEAQGMGAVAETVATNGTAPSWREANPEAYQELVSLLAANDPKAYASLCHAVATTDVEQKLGRVEAPALLVAGELDAVSPPAVNRELAAAMKRAEVVEIEDCAHQIQWEKPQELLAAVRTFLA